MSAPSSPSNEVFEVTGSRWRSTRNKTGRVWTVSAPHRYVPRGHVGLYPVGGVGSGGGVRAIYVPIERLHDPRHWLPVAR